MMPVSIARSMLVRDQMDWNRPHLKWIPDRYYRLRQAVITKVAPKKGARKPKA